MKKLKGITRTLVCIGVFIAVAACESTDCPINNIVYSTYGFYAATDEAESKIQVLDTLTITAAGTDSILINRLVRGSEVELPVSYSAATDTLIFHFTDTTSRTRRDTIWIDKENIPQYYMCFDCHLCGLFCIHNGNTLRIFQQPAFKRA